MIQALPNPLKLCWMMLSRNNALFHSSVRTWYVSAIMHITCCIAWHMHVLTHAHFVFIFSPIATTKSYCVRPHCYRLGTPRSNRPYLRHICRSGLTCLAHFETRRFFFGSRNCHFDLCVTAACLQQQSHSKLGNL
jgi:hypothetical protein